MCVGNGFAHCDFFFVGQKTGFDDDFQDFFAAGVFQKSDFVGNFFKVMFFHVADIDNHIDFVRALFQSLFRLKEFDCCLPPHMLCQDCSSSEQNHLIVESHQKN